MSVKRAALVAGPSIINVIVIDTAIDYTPGDGLTVVTLPDDSPVSPGWTYDGTDFTAPPTRSLTVDRATIPADGTTAAVVTYTDTYDDAPASVTFTANGATKAVTLTSAGNAILDVVSSTPGDTITVTVDAVPDQSVTVTVEA